MIEKLSHAQLSGLLIQSAETIESQAARIQYLEAEKAIAERQQHAEKIAAQAVDRNIIAEDDASGYAEKLASSERDLDDIEDLIVRSPAGGGLGFVPEHEKVASATSESADDKFIRDIMADA